jgi:hypothetical protein
MIVENKKVKQNKCTIKKESKLPCLIAIKKEMQIVKRVTEIRNASSKRFHRNVEEVTWTLW